MRIFVNNVDSHVGRALCADLRGALGQDTRLIGTLRDDGAEAKAELIQGLGVKRVVTRGDAKQYIDDVLSCSLIVYDLHSSDKEEVELVIKQLKIASLTHDVTFVLISSVNVWARTKKEYIPLETEDEEEEPAEEDGTVREVKKRPKELSDSDLDRRIPSPAFESWKYLETLTLSLSSKDKLRPHVIAAGILYGNGETTFNELFKAAWLTQPTHTIIHPGNNYLPCVHVRDVARLVKIVHVRDPGSSAIGQYLVAVDKSRHTQAEIVHGILKQISKLKEVPVVSADEADADVRDALTLDLVMEPSAPMSSASFPWWSRDGLVANLDKVAAEFCKWRNLRPVKMVILGPPGAGAEKLGAAVADRYLHAEPPHLTFERILQDAMSAGTRASERLRARVQKISGVPGAKLPLKVRTKLVQKRLQSNVCRYRGYVLEGYPASYEEADALFMEQVPAEGEEEPPAEEEEEEGEEEEEEEENDEPPPPPQDDEDEDEAGERPQRRLNSTVAPEFIVKLQSSADACKARIFAGAARGPATEEEFVVQTSQYQKANLAQDGSLGTSDLFSEVAGAKVLQLDVDSLSDEEAFQATRVYMEARGQFFNYLRSEEERCREQATELADRERAADEHRDRARRERQAAEQALRADLAAEEDGRRHAIARGEAALLDAEVTPLQQYLMANVVPTLSEGLADMCKEMPEDPIEFLAEYLFTHTQNVVGDF